MRNRNILRTAATAVSRAFCNRYYASTLVAVDAPAHARNTERLEANERPRYARQIFSSDEHREDVKFHPESVTSFSGNVTALTGSSRSGKSALANALVGCESFSVSSDPLCSHTLGAWGQAGPHGFIIDTEGQSHQVSESTKKIFCLVYPTCHNMIFTSKEMKPRLIILLRDADTFDFAVRDGQYADKHDRSVQDYLELSGTISRLEDLDLFSDIMGLGIPNLKSTPLEMVPTLGDMPRLLELADEPHKGPIIDIRDEFQTRAIVHAVNDSGGFNEGKFLANTLAGLAHYTIDETELAKEFGWESHKLRNQWEKDKADILRRVKAFPQLQQPTLAILADVEENMEELCDRIDRKIEHIEVVETDKIVYSDVEISRGGKDQLNVEDGEEAAKDLTNNLNDPHWVKGAGLGTSICSGISFAVGMMGGPPGIAVGASLGMASGYALGAFNSKDKGKREKILFRKPTTMRLRERRSLGFKLGPRLPPTSTVNR